jgi:hypothetical protein
MTETAMTSETTPAPSASLAARLIGVLFSPRDAYTAVAAKPRAAGALLVAIVIMALAQGLFLASDVGKSASLDQQLGVMKAVGVTVTDQMVQQLESRMAIAPYTTAVSLAIFVPLIGAGLAGLVLALFTAVLGGGATFKQVYAVVAHSMIIGALTQAFSVPIQYLRGDMASPGRLSVFFPMLPEMSFVTYLLSAIDVFILWSLINLSIGVAVLYKRKTGSVASVLLGIYAVVVVIIATVRAF